MRLLVSFLLTAVLSTSGIASADSQSTGSLAVSAEDIRVYSELYSASSIRNMMFNTQPDPRTAVCEEICLEAQLAALAETDDLSSNPQVLETIRLRLDMEAFEAWLRDEWEAPSEAELRDYYEQHKDAFVRPALVTFHHLFLMARDADEALEKLEKAKEIVLQARESGDLESLILKHSELEAAKTDGGKVGPVPIGKLNSAISDALRKLTPGQISEPVRSPYGWEILRLDSRTSETTRTFEEVREEIAESLFLKEAQAIRDSAGAKLTPSYPVTVNEQVLNNADDPDAVLATIRMVELTLGETSKTVVAMNVLPEVTDMRERIRGFLPQVILIEQIKLSAKDRGLLETEEFQAKAQFIRNRALAEAYMNGLLTKKEPTAGQLLEAFEAEKEVFRGPPYAKGILYKWNLPEDLETTSTGTRAFREVLLKDSVTSMVTAVREGRLSRNELAARADETKELDWFREGPMGYHHDMAWFKTTAGDYTMPYVDDNSLVVGFVEERKEPEQFPFERVRQQVRTRLMGKWTKQNRQELIEALLANCQECSTIGPQPGLESPQ